MVEKTYLNLNDEDELKVVRRLIDSARAGIYNYDPMRDRGCSITMSGEEARIRNLTLVHIDELEQRLEREIEDLKKAPQEASDYA